MGNPLMLATSSSCCSMLTDTLRAGIESHGHAIEDNGGTIRNRRELADLVRARPGARGSSGYDGEPSPMNVRRTGAGQASAVSMKSGGTPAALPSL